MKITIPQTIIHN